MFSHSNSNHSNNNPLPLNNLHLSHLQEDCLQQQEHKHKWLHHHLPQPRESGMALHLKPSLEIEARATNSSENSGSTGCSMKTMKQ